MNPSSLATIAARDLAWWRRVPNGLIVIGGLLALAGALLDLKQFGYAWLLAFMFFLSLSLGALFLVLVHHLFDAGWSVAIRRFCEHLACLLFPWLALLFVPVACLAASIYPWMQVANPQTDPALSAKYPLFTRPMFYGVAGACFGVWWVLSRGLRKWSLRQDDTGSAQCTFKMRTYAGWGIAAFAITLTLAAIMWMKALQHQWFSTLYGACYFAGSVWLSVATAYLLTLLLARQGVLRPVLHEHQFYFLGLLMFAFTVFYAYIHFSQYFIIWNANLPEETFWYVAREQGSWYYVGLFIIFGHFFVPFLALLRLDVKVSCAIMTPVCLWAWLLHYVDLAFNIMPVAHPAGFPWRWLWLDLGCLAFMAGVLAKVFVNDLLRSPAYPLKDPRLREAMGLEHPVPTQISGGELDETEGFADGAPRTNGGAT